MACAKYFQDQAKRDDEWDLQAAELKLDRGELPVISGRPPGSVRTPCRQCPKHALFPDNFGLDPRNEFAVLIYRQARNDLRVGLFDGAPLLRTITPEGVSCVLDIYDDYFANRLHRQRCFEKIMVIDAVATEVRGKREEEERQRRRAEAEANRERAGNKGRGTSFG